MKKPGKARLFIRYCQLTVASFIPMLKFPEAVMADAV
jgi:hypothetical protein